MKKYYLDGFTPPTGVQNAEQVATIQRRLGVTDDGLWGPKTDSAYRSYMNAMSRSPKTTKANPQQAVTTLTNTAKEYGKTYGSAGYTADSFPNAPAAYSGLTEASKAYKRTFGNPGYSAAQAKTAPSSPKQQAEALTNASIGYGTTFGSSGYTESYMKNHPFSGSATDALTNVSKSYGKTFGNPGYSANEFTSGSQEEKGQPSPYALYEYKKRDLISQIDAKLDAGDLKDKLKEFIFDASGEQIMKFSDFFEQNNIAYAFDEVHFKTSMRAALSGSRGSAAIVDTNSPSASEFSHLRPFIKDTENFDRSISFSYFYFDRVGYYTDIYRDGARRGRISFGVNLPDKVEIYASKSTPFHEIYDYMEMFAGIMFRGSIELFLNTGAGMFPVEQPLSDYPAISNVLDTFTSWLPTTGVNNYNEDAIIVQTKVWPKSMGEHTPRLYEIVIQK